MSRWLVDVEGLVVPGSGRYFGGVVRRCAKLSPGVLRIYVGGGQSFWLARSGNGRRRRSLIGVMGFRLSEVLANFPAGHPRRRPRRLRPRVFFAVCELTFSIRNGRLAEWVAKN